MKKKEKHTQLKKKENRSEKMKRKWNREKNERKSKKQKRMRERIAWKLRIRKKEGGEPLLLKKRKRERKRASHSIEKTNPHRKVDEEKEE